MWFYLMRDAAILSGKPRVLHVAPERSLAAHLREASSTYISVDAAMPGVNLKADLQDLPLPDDSFDLIVCIHVLDDVKDDLAALAELYRVCAKGGVGIILAPVFDHLPATMEVPDGKPDVRHYGRDFTQRLAKAGFDIEVVQPMRRYGLPMMERFGIRAGEDIYIMRKPA